MIHRKKIIALLQAEGVQVRDNAQVDELILEVAAIYKLRPDMIEDGNGLLRRYVADRERVAIEMPKREFKPLRPDRGMEEALKRVREFRECAPSLYGAR